MTTSKIASVQALFVISAATRKRVIRGWQFVRWGNLVWCQLIDVADWWKRWKCCCPVFYSPVLKTFTLNYGYWHLRADLAIVTLFDVKVEIGHCIIFLFSTVFVFNCFGWWYLCPGRFRCIRRLDCTILIGSEILFRLAPHDTLQCFLTTAEKGKENWRVFLRCNCTWAFKKWESVSLYHVDKRKFLTALLTMVFRRL